MRRLTRIVRIAARLIYLLLFMHGSVYSQPARLELISPADPGVSVAVFDPAVHGVFAGLVRSTEGARLIPYSIVLTNESSQHIVGVAVRWIVTDVNGASRETVWSSDSFSTLSVAAQQPVISGRTQLLATPIGLTQGRSTPGGRGSITLGAVGGQSTFDSRRVQLAQMDEFHRAVHVTAIVDTVIFEDGRIIGPDESHLVDYINGITAAAKTLVRSVRQTAAEGRDVDAFLRNLSASKRSGTLASLSDDPGGRWMMREAELLLRYTDGRAAILDQLERLPAPPTFFRK